MVEYRINEIIRMQIIYKKNLNKAHTAEIILGRTEQLIVNKISQKVVLKTMQHRKRRGAFRSSYVEKNRLEETVKKEGCGQNYGRIQNRG